MERKKQDGHTRNRCHNFQPGLADRFWSKQTNPTIVLSFHVGEIAPKVPAIIPICKIHALKPENMFKDKKKKKNS